MGEDRHLLGAVLAIEMDQAMVGDLSAGGATRRRSSWPPRPSWCPAKLDRALIARVQEAQVGQSRTWFYLEIPVTGFGFSR